VGALGVGRVIFATDYPFESAQVAGQFLNSAAITDDAYERVARGELPAC
jgi:predicted TIM-barrel fold metal-dependent hydrolase